MRDKIKEILKTTLDLNDIPDDISQRTCAEWDSMHHFQLMVELETAFDITLEPEDMANMKSLEEIEVIIRKYVEKI